MTKYKRILLYALLFALCGCANRKPIVYKTNYSELSTLTFYSDSEWILKHYNNEKVK